MSELWVRTLNAEGEPYGYVRGSTIREMKYSDHKLKAVIDGRAWNAILAVHVDREKALDEAELLISQIEEMVDQA